MRPEDGCTQPQCPMRSGATGRWLAELAVEALAGGDPAARVAPEQRIEPLERCVACVGRVMRGDAPFPTAATLQRLEEAGHWSWRRARRERLD